MSNTTEVNIDTALGWWPELPDKWTPVGWKNHLFRFNVLYNGWISAIPNLNKRTTAWKGMGVQLAVVPSATAKLPPYAERPRDNGSIIQGWNDCDAPVLWSEWAVDGLVLREEVFAHVPGGRPIETGTEPLFAWIRLSVRELLEGLPPPDAAGFSIRINGPNLLPAGMVSRHNLQVKPELAAYPRALSPEASAYDRADGLRILEPDGTVRLAVAPGAECATQFLPKTPREEDHLLHIAMPADAGARVDLLLPMLPTDRAVFDAEMALGYDGALAEADSFWRADVPVTRFVTPEAYINQTIEHGLKMTEVIAERDPATGHYSMLTGSWTYSALWATPGAMAYGMFLDPLGRHDIAARYLAMFKAEQGTVKPPGDSFEMHPGYLSSPKSLTSIDWLSDHGALLWAIAEHGLLSGDEQFISEWMDTIVRACDFIKDSRRITNHGGAAGIMPPAIATDAQTQIQAVWNDGWCYKGLTTAIRLLKRIGHPRTAEFAREAGDYRTAFAAALRTATEQMPSWTDSHGQVHHLVPAAAYGMEPREVRHAFYLDTGPLFAVFAGLLDADDDLMRSTLLWFREGPPAHIYRDEACWQVPSVHHEISSCEPCYSWNVFHPWQSGDRERFLEGMYSLFAGVVSRQTYTACETRGGVYGVTCWMLPVYLARLAVIDDQLHDDELHLLRFLPLAWLFEDKETCFENMPTEFGPLTLGVRLENRVLKVRFEPAFRVRPRRIVLYVPPAPGLEAIELNDSPLNWDSTTDSIEVGNVR